MFYNTTLPPLSDHDGGGSVGGLSLLSATACSGAFAADSSGAPIELVEEPVSLSLPKVAGRRESGSPPRIAEESAEGGWAVVV